MQLYCPSCKTSVGAAERCPHCGDRLVTPSEVFASSGELGATPPPLIRPTPLGRVAVGVVVAIGLYVGLHEEIVGIVTALEMGTPFADGTGIAFTLALRTVCVLIGGLFAGAGRPHGFLTGWMMGLVCGGLLLGADTMAGLKPTSLDWCALVGLAVVASVASVVGSRIWPPVVDIPVPVTNPRGSSLARLASQDDEVLKAPPTAWVRLCVAVALGVAAVAFADTLRDQIKRFPGGVLNLGTPAQAPFYDFAFAAFGLALAGTVAGGNTGAGLRHGLYFGLATGLITTVLAFTGNAAVQPPVDGFLETIGVGADSARSNSAMLLLFVATFGFGVVSGLFGSILLPTVAPKWRRSRLLEQS